MGPIDNSSIVDANPSSDSFLFFWARNANGYDHLIGVVLGVEVIHGGVWDMDGPD